MSSIDDPVDININIDKLRDKVQSYPQTRLIIKLLGVLAMFVTLYLGLWLPAVLLWILFFPDLNDIVGFFQNRQKVNWLYKE